MHYIRSFLIAGLFVPFSASIPLSVPLLETAPDLPYTWEYKGCFVDRIGSRALKRAITSDGEMTGGWCARWCSEQGYNLAGTEWGRECYCGYEINRPVETREADCQMPCAGWSTEACGGSQRITVYETLSGNPPSTNPGTPGFPSLGCYSDSIARRALPVRGDYEGGLDVAKCISSCSSRGFALAGVEYGYECYCGNALDNSRLIPGDGSASGCDFVCSGAPEEFCGGSSRMNLYGTLPSIVPSSSVAAPTSTTPTPTPTPSASSAITPIPTSETLSPLTTPTPAISSDSSTTPVVDSTPAVQVPNPESQTLTTPSSTPLPDTSSADVLSSSSASTPTSVIDATPVEVIAPTVV